MGDVEDPPKHSGGGKQQGWLGSLLSRRGSGPPGPGDANNAAGKGYFNRFSAITEERCADCNGLSLARLASMLQCTGLVHHDQQL